MDSNNNDYQNLPDAPHQYPTFAGYNNQYLQQPQPNPVHSPPPQFSHTNPAYYGGAQHINYPQVPIYSVQSPNVQMPLPVAHGPSRLWEIEFELTHGHNCYKCWLWFMLIISMVGLFINAIGIVLDPNFIYIFTILLGIMNCVVYNLGIRAPKERNLEKNELFKRCIIFLTIVSFISVGIFTIGLAEMLQEVPRQSHVNDKDKEQEKLAITVALILEWVLWFGQLIVNVLVYITADKISKLLKERDRFSSYPQIIPI
jgi:hypothetical protein